VSSHCVHIAVSLSAVLVVCFSAQRNPDPAGFKNPESRPEDEINKLGIRDPVSVWDLLQCGTSLD
jgi:hypothetical protein